MPISCDPNDLSKAASCFQCLSAKELEGVKAYLLAVKAGGPTDAATLVKLAGAAGFVNLSPKEQKAVQVYLECTLVNL